MPLTVTATDAQHRRGPALERATTVPSLRVPSRRIVGALDAVVGVV